MIVRFIWGKLNEIPFQFHGVVKEASNFKPVAHSVKNDMPANVIAAATPKKFRPRLRARPLGIAREIGDGAVQ